MCVVLGSQFLIAQSMPTSNDVCFDSIQNEMSKIEKEIKLLNNENQKRFLEIESLTLENERLKMSFDSLSVSCSTLYRMQKADKDTISEKISNVNNTVALNKSVMENRTLLGIAVAVLIILLSGGSIAYLSKRMKSGRDSIDEVRKAQDALQIAQTKMQEESIKLDNKLLEIAEHQMKLPAMTGDITKIDHSLALKVADEIVRIELNLSRMDSSIKGYKQLAKAVQRIKDNFQANGYEIVDMLGKPYNEGMKVIANFVSDENLEHGQQIITGIIKPQINYNGKMIQSAQITVNQNI